MLVAAATHGSLSAAAVSLDITQASASRQLARLEAEFGGRLFHRNGRGVQLTELGATVTPQVRALLDDLTRIREQSNAQSRVPSGDVHLGVVPSVARPLVSRLYASLKQTFPKIRLVVREGFTGPLEESLERGTVDLAVLNRYGKPALGEDVLLPTSMSLVGRKGASLTRAPSIAFRQLDGIPLVLPSRPNAFRVVLDQLARRQRVRIEESLVVDSFGLMIDAVIHGGCYTIVPNYTLEHDPSRSQLQAAKIVRPTLERAVTLSISDSRPATLAVLAVARQIRDAFAATPRR